MTSIATAISIARTTREIRLRMVWAVCLTAASVVTIPAANDASVITAAQVNGTWATPAGEFKIWAFDHHHLRVEFSVAAEHKGATSENTPRRRHVQKVSTSKSVFRFGL